MLPIANRLRVRRLRAAPAVIRSFFRSLTAALMFAATGTATLIAQPTEFWPPEENYAVAGYSKTAERSERWRDGAWEATNREHWGYLEGKLSEKSFDSMWGEDWRTSRRERYTYARSPATMTITKEDRRVNVYAKTERQLYTYDEDGNLISMDWSAFGPNDQLIPVWQNTFTGQKDGDRITWIHVQRRWTGNTWNDATRFTTTHDASGQILTGLQEEMADSGWSERQRLEYTYADGCIAKRSLRLLREGAWITGLEERYECDAAGVVMEVYHYTPWNESGDLQSALRERFTYDEAGNRVETVYERIVDGEWVPSRRTTATFHPSGQEPALGSTSGTPGGSTNLASGADGMLPREGRTQTEPVGSTGESSGISVDTPSEEPGISGSTITIRSIHGSMDLDSVVTFSSRPLLFERRGSMWRIGADGSIERIDTPGFESSFAAFYSSPDRRVVAFIPGHPMRIPAGTNLHLLDTGNGSHRQITSVGQSEADGFASVIVDMIGWKPNGLGLYYSVQPNREVEGGHNTTPRPGVEYGVFAFDVISNEHRQVGFPGDYIAAVDNRNVLFSEPVGSPAFPGVFVHNVYSDTRTETFRLSAEYRLYEGVNAAATRLAALTWRSGPSRRLALLEIRDGAIVAHGLPDRWQSVDKIRLSPAGSRWAYMGMADPATFFLLVGDFGIHAGGRFEYAWIDEESIAISTDTEIRVVDVSTGKIRGRVTV